MRSVTKGWLAILFVLAGAAPCLARHNSPGSEPSLGGRPLSAWVRDLQDRDPSVREQALRTVPLFGLPAREALSQLMAGFRETDSALRCHAVIAVGTIGLDEKHHKSGVTALARLLNDTQGIVRMHAATSLGRIGPAAAAAIPALITATRDASSWEIRRAAVYALGAVGRDAASTSDSKVYQALTLALGDVSSAVRLEAVQSLSTIGAPVQTVLKQKVLHNLQQATGDREGTVSIWARVAIMRFEQVSEIHLNSLTSWLRAPLAAHRAQAARALGMIGSAATTRVPDLADAVAKDKDPAVVATSLWALAQIGEDGKKALGELAKHANPDIKKAASEALAGLHPAAMTRSN